MLVTVNLYSQQKGEIDRFLSHFYNTNLNIENTLSWKKTYSNPIELAEIVGTFIDNSDDFDLNMWVNLDKNVFVRISEENADEIIKYLYERFPY